MFPFCISCITSILLTCLPKHISLKFNLSSSCWLIKINLSGIQYFQSEKLIISFSHLTAFKRFSTKKKKKFLILKTEWKALNNFLAASLSFPQHVLWFLAIPIYLVQIHYALLYLCFHTFKSSGFGATSIIWIYRYENFIFLPIISPKLKYIKSHFFIPARQLT